MNITVVQPDIIWEDKARNFQNLTELISPLYNKTDIVILPEMFNTGFSMNPSQLSESSSGETCRWMISVAEKGNFGMCGSYIVKGNENFFNRWVFVSPENEEYHYDKRHLFSMGGEDNLFSAGVKRLIFTFRGVTISPYICYDLRFPVWSRNRKEFDLMIYSANWPEARSEVWSTLLKARAIENQCYVAGSNRTGTDGAGIKYCGNSMIIDPRGNIIASAGSEAVSCITSEVSMVLLSEFREKFPVSRDADDFTLIL